MAMADDVKIEYTSNTMGPRGMWWVDIHMTNKRGTQYRAVITRTYNGCLVRHVFNVPNDRYYCLKDAPKWVQKTIEEQLPVVAIMMS